MPTTIQRCPICNAGEIESMYAYGPAKFKILETRVIQMQGCRACGGVFQNPLPDPDELDTYYRTKWETQCSATQEGYQRYEGMADLLCQALDPEPTEPKRVLDFGCGYGTLLDAMGNRGWQTFGVEPGAEARIAAGRRHSMFDRLPEVGQYELIVLSHVVEHFRDPLGELRRIRPLLAPRGSLYVAVPDLGRLPKHRNIQNIFNAPHLFAFTACSLRHVLGRAGFRVYQHLENAPWDAADSIPSDRTLRLRLLARADGGIASIPDDEQSPLLAAQDALAEYFRCGPASSRIRYALPVWMQAAWYRLRR